MDECDTCHWTNEFEKLIAEGHTFSSFGDNLDQCSEERSTWDKKSLSFTLSPARVQDIQLVNHAMFFGF